MVDSAVLADSYAFSLTRLMKSAELLMGAVVLIRHAVGCETDCFRMSAFVAGSELKNENRFRLSYARWSRCILMIIKGNSFG